MRHRVFKFFVVAAVAIASLTGVSTALAAPVHHKVEVASAHRAWSCTSRYVCFYANLDGTGFGTQFYMPNVGGQWLTIPSTSKGSMFNNGNSAVEVWNAQSGFHACYVAFSQVDLNNNFGHFYVHYGIPDNCTGIPPFGGQRPATTEVASAKRFTCPFFGICPFTQTNLMGTGIFQPNSAIPPGSEFNFRDVNGDHPQSVRNHSGDNLWLLDRSHGTYRCVIPGDYNNTNGSFGYGELDSSSNSDCTDSHPSNLT